MNRLENRVAPWLSQSQRKNSERLQDQSFQLNSPHRLFFPEHYESRYSYPLFIWLHSNGSSEVELDGVASSISLRNYVGLGLRGTHTLKCNDSLYRWGTSLNSMQSAADQVLESIDEICEQLPIRADRVFIGGFGETGTLAQWLGLRNANRFAGVVSIHGAFPKRFRPLIDWKSARNLPTLFMYGQDSNLCDTDEVCRTIRCARTGGLNYRFNQFNCGDELFTDMCSEANRFMMEIVNEPNRSSSQHSIIDSKSLTSSDRR